MDKSAVSRCFRIQAATASLLRKFTCLATVLATGLASAQESTDTGDSLNRELERFVARERANAKNLLAPEESFKVTAELMTLLGKMAGNTLLELFVRILWNEISVSRTTGTFEDSLEIVRKNYVTRLRVAEAVLEKDQAKAAAAWRVRSEFLRSWPRRGFRLTRRVNMA